MNKSVQKCIRQVELMLSLQEQDKNRKLSSDAVDSILLQ